MISIFCLNLLPLEEAKSFQKLFVNPTTTAIFCKMCINLNYLRV